MQITKHGHACLVLEDSGKKLVIDAGSYTDPLENLTDVVAVVATHVHDDHVLEAQLDRILAANPGIQIFTTPEAAKRLDGYETVVVYHGDHYPVGPFTLEFFGDLHAVIHDSYPRFENRGVLVNDTLYYPGDSFVTPDRPVACLAVPTSGPWMKIAEVIDFINEVKPQKSFATHNALNSDKGNVLANSRVKMTTEANGGEYLSIADGASFSL